METALPAPAADLHLPDPPPAEEKKENRFWETSSHSGRPANGTSMRTVLTHDAVIDCLLANPRATRQQIAETLGFKTASSISIIINSDAFQARYAKRRSEIIDPIVTASVEDRIKLLASTSAENLARHLEINPNDFKSNLEVFKEATRAGSYGVTQQSAVQTTFVVALPGPAASSGEWMARFAPADQQAGVVRPRLDDAPIEDVTPKE